MKKIKEIRYAGSRSGVETERERAHRKLSAKAAAEGMVLLENKGMLPLKERGDIALFGSGARHTVTGGTGSGDVHERYSVNIEKGLINAGFKITTSNWLDAYDEAEEIRQKAYYADIYKHAQKMSKEKEIAFDQALIQVYLHSPAYIPEPGPIPSISDLEKYNGETAIYVLVRNAGEGKDRSDGAGDYRLTQEERESIRLLGERFEQLLVIINCGSVIDVDFMDTCKVDALLYIHQPGMEAGTAVARILTGEVSPSGKLTDTWPVHYEDYPNSETFSYRSGDTSKEYYQEGIYVGYRYFEKAGIVPRYAFGYGLSYTKFEWKRPRIVVEGDKTEVTLEVTNTGAAYAGREVIQVYASLPCGMLAKEEKRLVAFAKTKLLIPGETQTLRASFEISSCASFDESRSSYILEPGHYGILVGNASNQVDEIGYLHVAEEIVVQRTASVCPPKEKLQEIQLPDCKKTFFSELPVFEVEARKVQKPDAADVNDHACHDSWKMTESEEQKRILNHMTDEQMAVLVCGASATLPSDSPARKEEIGMAAITVPGAAGETTTNYAREPWNLANIILADGPAGLRLVKYYQLDPDGKPYEMSVMEKFFGSTRRDEGTDYYQFCTRIPSGTLLAQTFDTGLMEDIGRLVAEEMIEFHVTLWLAPGMNIHRNALCGRNFEYYSEDPLLSGKMAAAITRGVQNMPGVGTTIKHFACNNQEDNRHHCDAVVSERALREIYLKGFEIAIKESAPLAVMSSYNLINGIHSANNYDLLTNVLRKEWGYQGMVMTDWNTTTVGGSKADLCIRAGNDLIMPGDPGDVREILEGMKKTEGERLLHQELRTCAARIVGTILQSNRYEDA